MRALGQEALAEVRADEAGAAGDQNSHVASDRGLGLCSTSMRPSRWLGFALIGACTTTGTGGNGPDLAPQPSKASVQAAQELRQLQYQWRRALSARDTAFFRSVLADEFLLTGDATTQTKADFLLELADSSGAVPAARAEETNIRLFGNISRDHRAGSLRPARKSYAGHIPFYRGLGQARGAVAVHPRPLQPAQRRPAAGGAPGRDSALIAAPPGGRSRRYGIVLGLLRDLLDARTRPLDQVQGPEAAGIDADPRLGGAAAIREDQRGGPVGCDPEHRPGLPALSASTMLALSSGRMPTTMRAWLTLSTKARPVEPSGRTVNRMRARPALS